MCLVVVVSLRGMLTGTKWVLLRTRIEGGSGAHLACSIVLTILVCFSSSGSS